MTTTAQDSLTQDKDLMGCEQLREGDKRRAMLREGIVHAGNNI